MIKQGVVLVLLTVVAVFFQMELSHVVNGVLFIHRLVAELLHAVFSDGDVGLLIQRTVALLIIPLLCGALMAILLWLFKRPKMPTVMTVIWVVWLVFLVTMIAVQSPHRKAAVHQSAKQIADMTNIYRKI